MGGKMHLSQRCCACLTVLRDIERRPMMGGKSYGKGGRALFGGMCRWSVLDSRG